MTAGWRNKVLLRTCSLVVAIVGACALTVGLLPTPAGALTDWPVTVTGTQVFGGSPNFTPSPTDGPGGAGDPMTGSVTCSTVNSGTGIDSSLPANGSYTIDAGSCSGLSLSAADAADYDIVYVGGDFSVSQATPTTPTISNLPNSDTFGGGFTATVSTDGDGTTSITSNSTSVCTVNGFAVSYVAVGTCSLTAHVAAGTDYTAADGTPQTFDVTRGTPTTPTISNLPNSNQYGGGFTATVSTTGDGATSVTASPSSVCTASGLVVSYVGVGNCSLTAHVAAGLDYAAADGSPQSVTVGRAPWVVTISGKQAYKGSPTFSASPSSGPSAHYTGSVSCTKVNGGTPISPNLAYGGNYVIDGGSCSGLALQGSDATDYSLTYAGSIYIVGQATPTPPTVSNVPASPVEFGSFAAHVDTSGDGTTSVTSSTPAVCTMAADQHTVSFVGFGTCALTPSVSAGNSYFAATGSTQAFAVAPAPRGYWLVGSDGGIFDFGAAGFFGSMGGTVLQRPVVGITPTSSRAGYWLVASDGGLFAFGDAGYHGSVPGLGLHPAGSGQSNSLNAPIVGMVPSTTGGGYFMVASDGGVFAFGDARFEGSCPGIGGCPGSAVAVLPDHSGNGYWLVTSTGSVYAFGDAPFRGAPPPQSIPVVSAAATPDGRGYWILYANGVVASFGDASALGGPLGYVNAYNPAAAIFPVADGKGYWIAAARGDVFTYGDAPFLGGMAARPLNGNIIAADGF